MSDSRVYRVLVLGTGFATRVQIPVFRDHPRFEVAGVCSRTPERAEEVAAGFEIPRHGSDWREMTAGDGFDLVSVVTEVADHVEPAVAALEAGKHLLLEKPMAATLEEGRRIAAAAAASGVHAAINHEFRYQPDVLTLKGIIESGELGGIRGLEMRSFMDFWADPDAPTFGWLSRAERGGGILGAMGSHTVDQVRFLTGREVAGTRGSVYTVLSERNDEKGRRRAVTADDTAAFTMALEGGIPVTVALHASVWWKETVIRVFCERGTATINGSGTVSVRTPGGEVEARAPDPGLALPGVDPDIRKPLFALLLDRLARRCDGETVADLATVEDGLAVMRVLEAVRAGFADG